MVRIVCCCRLIKVGPSAANAATLQVYGQCEKCFYFYIFFSSVFTLPSMSLDSDRSDVLRLLLLLLLFLFFVRLPFSSFPIRTLNHVCELDGTHTTTCSKRSNTSRRPNTNCNSNSHNTWVNMMLLSSTCNSSDFTSRTSKLILR